MFTDMHNNPFSGVYRVVLDDVDEQ